MVYNFLRFHVLVPSIRIRHFEIQTLLRNVHATACLSGPMTLPYYQLQPGQPLHGVFLSIYAQMHGDVHDEKIVQILPHERRNGLGFCQQQTSHRISPMQGGKGSVPAREGHL